MSFEYIRTYYKVPAEVGRRVRVLGSNGDVEGVIVGTMNQYLRIHLDGENKPKGVYHPTDRIEYLGMSVVPKLSAAQKRWRRYIELSDLFDNFREFLAYEKLERQAALCGFSDVREYSEWLKS